MEWEPRNVCETIGRVLERNLLGVLATQRKGQPHASLIALTPLEGVRSLGFATHRNTLKYQSILEDPRVAVLVQDREGDPGRPDGRLVVTAIGEAISVPERAKEAYVERHLRRHPELESFLKSPDCEFVIVAVRAYQVVGDIEDVKWYTIEELIQT